MSRYIRFVVRHRWAVLFAIAAITAAAGWSLSRGVVSSSIGGLFLGEHPDYPRYLERAVEFSSDDVIIVSIDEVDPLAVAHQDRLRRAVDRFEQLPAVSAVQSILNVQEIVGDEDGLTVQAYAERAVNDAGARADLTRTLTQDPFAEGLLISRDGEHHNVIVELDNDAGRSAEHLPGLIADIRTVLDEAGFARDQVHVVGLSANIGAVIGETYFSLERLFPIVLLVLLAAVGLLFRQLWPVVITGLTALVAVTWTMGFSVLLDPHISIFTGMVPVVILIIAFSDVIHLCSAYLLELGRGEDKAQAILNSCSDVGAACVFTSLTTFVGFVSLSLVPTPAGRLLGLVLGFGAGSALLIAMTVTPILFSLLPEPRDWRRGSAGVAQRLLDRFLAWVAGVTSRRPWAVVSIFALGTGVLLVGLTQLTIQTDFAKRLNEDHPLRRDGDHFRAHFDGANSFDIYITTPEPGGLLDPVTIRRVATLQAAVTALPEVARTQSLVDLFERLHGALTVTEYHRANLPESRGALAQYLLLFEMSGGTELDRLVDADRRVMRLTAHLPTEEYRRTAQIGWRAEALAREILDGVAEVEASGLVFLLGGYFDVILADQQMALMLLFVVITVMMAVGLRSVRVGLLSMIPNLLPLLGLGGFVGLFWDYVDSDTLLIAMIAIGIGVDDTIHFLMRFRIESRRQATTEDAIARTFAYSGRGIVITTVILVVGFLPFATSDYLTMFMLGTLLPLALVVALLGDLFLAPALAQLGLIRFDRRV